jgi:hypothetical protein
MVFSNSIRLKIVIEIKTPIANLSLLNFIEEFVANPSEDLLLTRVADAVLKKPFEAMHESFTKMHLAFSCNQDDAYFIRRHKGQLKYSEFDLMDWKKNLIGDSIGTVRAYTKVPSSCKTFGNVTDALLPRMNSLLSKNERIVVKKLHDEIRLETRGGVHIGSIEDTNTKRLDLKTVTLIDLEKPLWDSIEFIADEFEIMAKAISAAGYTIFSSISYVTERFDEQTSHIIREHNDHQNGYHFTETNYP